MGVECVYVSLMLAMVYDHPPGVLFRNGNGSQALVDFRLWEFVDRPILRILASLRDNREVSNNNNVIIVGMPGTYLRRPAKATRAANPVANPDIA